MSLGGRIFARTYDRAMAGPEKAGLRAHRQALLSGVTGRVLEIGGGTGANLPFYGPDVESLTMTEPEAPMVARLERRVREQSPLTTVLRAPAEDLPFEDDTFDFARVGSRALHRQRSAARTARVAPCTPARQPASVHRARAFR
jgi:ubiquinone/menaquinone biosynthesis C-methylase UbiE